MNRPLKDRVRLIVAVYVPIAPNDAYAPAEIGRLLRVADDLRDIAGDRFEVEDRFFAGSVASAHRIGVVLPVAPIARAADFIYALDVSPWSSMSDTTLFVEGLIDGEDLYAPGVERLLGPIFEAAEAVGLEVLA
jgi:hypothetical protein